MIMVNILECNDIGLDCINALYF